MAGDGADALQVPPAIPAVDREDPEGVSGESAAAATAAANLAALARQGADDMASEAGGRVGAAAAAPGGGAARVPAMTTRRDLEASHIGVCTLDGLIRPTRRGRSIAHPS